MVLVNSCLVASITQKVAKGHMKWQQTQLKGTSDSSIVASLYHGGKEKLTAKDLSLTRLEQPHGCVPENDVSSPQIQKN
jgi:hypothetical protein